MYFYFSDTFIFSNLVHWVLLIPCITLNTTLFTKIKALLTHLYVFSCQTAELAGSEITTQLFCHPTPFGTKTRLCPVHRQFMVLAFKIFLVDTAWLIPISWLKLLKLYPKCWQGLFFSPSVLRALSYLSINSLWIWKKLNTSLFSITVL